VEECSLNAELEGWTCAEWWKLLLRPSHLPVLEGLATHPLPSDITVDDVFSDYLAYIKGQLKEFITASYGDGDALWTTLFPSAYVVLTAPNGWEAPQQHRMREAAIRAGLVNEEGGRRVRFVSEAEVRYWRIDALHCSPDIFAARQLYSTLRKVAVLEIGSRCAKHGFSS
jgi:hypothetical protein